MNILIFGCGMYVCGSEFKPEGPILAAIATFSSIYKQSIDLYIILKNKGSIDKAQEKLSKSNSYKFLNNNSNITTYLITEEEAYSNTKINLKSSNKNVSLICSPDYCHFHQASWSLSNSITTLLMKPPVSNLEELNKLIELSEEFKTEGYVEFHKRWDPQFQYLRQKISNSKDLRVYEIVIEYGQPSFIVNNIFSEWDKISDPFTYIGCHYVDLLSYLFEAYPISINFKATKDSNLIKAKTKADLVHAEIGWKSNKYGEFLSNIFTNWLEPEGSDAISRQQISILTNKWRFEGDQKERGIKLTEENVSQVNPHYINETYFTDASEYFASGYAIDSICGFLLNSVSRYPQFEKNCCTIKRSTSTMEVLDSLENHLCSF